MPPRNLPLNRWFFQPFDTPQITQAVCYCLDHQLNLLRFGPQLKVSDISFYPGRGTIVVGSWRFPEKGLEAFQRLIARRLSDGDVSVLRASAFKRMAINRPVPADPIASIFSHLPAGEDEAPDPQSAEGHTGPAQASFVHDEEFDEAPF